MSNADDEFQRILLAAQAGADWAVAILYRAHNPKLARYLRAHEPVDHPDVASETWLDASRNLRTFEGSEHDFAGWLFTIARRRLIDHRRARRRRPADPAPDTAFSHLTSQSAESVVLGDEGARQIVELLPPDQAEVLLLRVVAGFDAETVGRLTGRRPGAVRVMQHRALQRLARDLDGRRNEPEEVSDGTPRDAQAPTLPR